MLFRLIHAKRVILGYIREFIGGSVKRVISGYLRQTCCVGLFRVILGHFLFEKKSRFDHFIRFGGVLKASFYEFRLFFDLGTKF